MRTLYGKLFAGLVVTFMIFTIFSFHNRYVSMKEQISNQKAALVFYENTISILGEAQLKIENTSQKLSDAQTAAKTELKKPVMELQDVVKNQPSDCVPSIDRVRIKRDSVRSANSAIAAARK